MSATKTKKPAAEAVEEGKTNAATEALTDERTAAITAAANNPSR